MRVRSWVMDANHILFGRVKTDRLKRDSREMTHGFASSLTRGAFPVFSLFLALLASIANLERVITGPKLHLRLPKKQQYLRDAQSFLVLGPTTAQDSFLHTR